MKSSFRVQDILTKGRGLIAARDIAAGETFLQDPPIVTSVTEELKKFCCASCLRWFNRPELKIDPASCHSCHESWFCNSVCLEEASQTSHMPFVCLAFHLLASSPHLDLQTKSSLRWLLALFTKSPKFRNFFMVTSSVDTINVDVWDVLMKMDGGNHPLPKDVVETASLCHSFLRQVAHSNSQSLLTIPRNGSETESLAAVEQVLAVDARNTFGVMAPLGEGTERRCRGMATYEVASLVNHSCYPNACRFDNADVVGPNNLHMTLRAIRSIPEGEEICISYFPIFWNLRERQRRLKTEYGFECNCQRCQLESKWGIFGANKAMDDEDEDEDEDGKEEDESDVEEGIEESEVKDTSESEGGQEDDGLLEEESQHSLFFVFHLCPTEGCGGTMAPFLASSSFENKTGKKTMDCNACGSFFDAEDLIAAG